MSVAHKVLPVEIRRAEARVRHWLKKRDQLYAEAARNGHFPWFDVALLTGLKKKLSEESYVVRKMKKIGTRDRVIFFYCTEENTFYSAESSKRWIPKGQPRKYHVAVLLEPRGSAGWLSFVRLMQSQPVRKAIKAIAA